MIPFFSMRHHRKEQIAGRAVVTAAAFLFLLTAFVQALPSKEALADWLDRTSLVGFHPAEETTTALPSELEEFSDRPPVPSVQDEPSADLSRSENVGDHSLL